MTGLKLKSLTITLVISVLLVWSSSFGACNAAARRGRHWRHKRPVSASLIAKKGKTNKSKNVAKQPTNKSKAGPPAPPSKSPYHSTFNVLMFGAMGNGRCDDTKAFEAAWAAACKVEASTIIVPSGSRFLLGPISFSGPYCKPNIVFQLDGTIVAPKSFKAWGSNLLWWIEFTKLKGITIQGTGTIDGGGSIWWQDTPYETTVDSETQLLIPFNDTVLERPPMPVSNELSQIMPRIKPTQASSSLDSVMPISEISSDAMFSSKSDNPGSQLTSTIFDGRDFSDWSYNVRLALGAKYKLGFIDGTTKKPDTEGDELARWTRTDYMVRCWITNSMIKSISSCFRYVTSAKQLWEELEERYSPSNAPLLFQLRRTLANFKQDSLNITDYYGKLVLLWDDLRAIDPILFCSCDARKSCTCDLNASLTKADNRNKLIDFLMGLNDVYDGVRSQILGMDPLPTLNKAFFLVQQIESQRTVSGETVMPISAPSTEISALAAGKHHGRFSKEDYKRSKQQRFCDHCKQKGHSKDSCFQLTGYPDWYKGPKSTELPHSRFKANNVQFDSPLDSAAQNGKDVASSSSHMDPAFISSICQELVKAFKGKSVVEQFSGANFAGPLN